MFLHGDFIKADRLECCRAGADAADMKAFHPIHHTADGRKIPKVSPEFFKFFCNKKGFQYIWKPVENGSYFIN